MEEQTQSPKQALLQTIKQSTNILVTVSSNPSVDQLAACLGLTLWLNKSGKHATAVFSGKVPSTLEFLKPAETLEKNTDSLRDFIIALDKSKADKLRYKVEDTVVKIFITPYRTSLTADDLEYSQGDFNVDMVIALGVHAQADLDGAITAHGRILHDAAVATVTTGEQASELGSVSWHDAQSSSLSELVTDLGNEFGHEHLDKQTATALLTGIVAETDRFSNERTTPQTMSVSAELMAAGADQQLVATKLDAGALDVPAVPEPEEVATDDAIADILDADEPVKTPADPNTLEIDHVPEPVETEPEEELTLPSLPDAEAQPEETSEDEQSSRLVTEPPVLGGTLTANSRPDDIMQEPSSDPFSAPNSAANGTPLLDRDYAIAPPKETPAAVAAELEQASSVEQPLQPAPPAWMPPQPWMSPSEQPAPQAAPTEPAQAVVPEEPSTSLPAASGEQGLDTARDEVLRALHDNPAPTPEPVQALNAQPIDLTPAPAFDTPAPQPEVPPTPVEQPLQQPLPSQPEVPQEPLLPSQPPVQPQPEQDGDFDPGLTQQPSVSPDYTGPVNQPFSLPVPEQPLPPTANPIPPTTPADPLAPPPVPPPLMPPGFPPAGPNQPR